MSLRADRRQVQLAPAAGRRGTRAATRIWPDASSGLRAALGVSATTLARRLKPLLDQGLVVREGRGAGTRYRWLGAEAVELPDPRWAVALRLARSEGRVTRGALASALGVSERTATRILAAMVDAGLLVASGDRGRAVSYRLPSSR